jgi:hypothetical protein
MRFSFDGVLVKLNNRRLGKIPTATCGRICRTFTLINDLSRRCRYFPANGNRAGQRLDADEVFTRSKTSPPEFLCKP